MSILKYCRRLGGAANYFYHSYLVWRRSNPDENNMFRVCPDRPRDPTRVKRAQRGADHPPLSSALLRMGTIFISTSFLYVRTYVEWWPLPLISLKWINSYTFSDFLHWLQFDIFGVLLINLYFWIQVFCYSSAFLSFSFDYSFRFLLVTVLLL